jgi:hypothetical protein
MVTSIARAPGDQNRADKRTHKERNSATHVITLTAGRRQDDNQ